MDIYHIYIYIYNIYTRIRHSDTKSNVKVYRPQEGLSGHAQRNPIEQALLWERSTSRLKPTKMLPTVHFTVWAFFII